MVNKYLEKKVELMPVEGMFDFKKQIELEYYILESDINELSELSGTKVYGIEIVKKTEEKSYESEFVKNVSCCVDHVKQILNKLANNTVTPVGLPFVLDDMLGA